MCFSLWMLWPHLANWCKPSVFPLPGSRALSTVFSTSCSLAVLFYIMGFVGNLHRSVLGLTSWWKPCQHLAMDLLPSWEYGEMAKETQYSHVLGSSIWRNTQNRLCTCVLPFGSQKYRRGFTSFYISCNCKGHLSTSYFSYCPKMACCTFDFLIFLSSAPP